MQPIEVDGSEGEGGGQILRTAVAFASIQRRPVRVVRIRAGRDVPGLRRQHVSALRVLAGVFGGRIEGDEEGSSEITFSPGEGHPGSLSVDMGTAASITLVLQAVVPAISLTRSSLRLDLVGGTDVPWSPTLDYFDRVVRPAYASVGISFDVKAERRGYYPRGGGRVSATIEPCASVLPLGLVEGKANDVMIVSRCSSLPRQVAERQLSSAAAVLHDSGFKVVAEEATDSPSDSPGSSILIHHLGSDAFLGADGLGAKGKPSEVVGKEAAGRFAGEARTGAQLDSNLGDMLIPLLSMAHEPSVVSVPAVTSHLRSGLNLAETFTGCRWSVGQDGQRFIVRVDPKKGR